MGRYRKAVLWCNDPRLSKEIREGVYIRYMTERSDEASAVLGEKDASVWGCSSAGRAPALQAGGQRFEPAHLHHLLRFHEALPLEYTA